VYAQLVYKWKETYFYANVTTLRSPYDMSRRSVCLL